MKLPTLDELDNLIATALRDHQRRGHGPAASDPTERKGQPVTTLWIDQAEMLGTRLAAMRVLDFLTRLNNVS